MKVKWPLVCPKDHRHNQFIAYVEIRGNVRIDNHGTILNLEEVLGCEVPITKIKPDLCAMCDTPLVWGPSWHKRETEEQLKQRIISDMALDEEEIKDFDLESYRCGLCWNIYDNCNCAETGMR